MNKKISCSILVLMFGAAWSFAAPQMIAFERNRAVWIANLDGTGEKKIADGISPAIAQGWYNRIGVIADTERGRFAAVVMPPFA
jgi:hypothetical protein